MITFLDHDDVWYPEHLSKSVAALAADAAAVAAFSAMEIVSADRAHGRVVEGQGVDRHTVLSGGDRPSLNAFVIRRAWFDEVDGFDTRYEWGEDVDLIFKLVEHGHFAYVDEVAAIYRIHGGNWSGDTRRTGVSVDRMMGDHLRRARRSGDTEAQRDLRRVQAPRAPLLCRGGRRQGGGDLESQAALVGGGAGLVGDAVLAGRSDKRGREAGGAAVAREGRCRKRPVEAEPSSDTLTDPLGLSSPTSMATEE